jgi:FOG: EAL domain
MYVSKDTHTPVVYAADYDHNSRARLALIGELRRAITNGELVVHYQPQARAGTGDVHMVEALVRWQHPEHGLLGPDQFIPLAEQTGLIRKLTLHVLDTALGQCRVWNSEGRSLGVAVNITGRELVDLRFPDEVRKLLSKWSIQPGQLELEITESTIMSDPPSARAVIARLSELGVSLAIDDFGSGQSSLGYLTQLPISVLKIDKSFVLKMADTRATRPSSAPRSTSVTTSAWKSSPKGSRRRICDGVSRPSAATCCRATASAAPSRPPTSIDRVSSGSCGRGVARRLAPAVAPRSAHNYLRILKRRTRKHQLQPRATSSYQTTQRSSPWLLGASQRVADLPQRRRP